MLQLLSVIAILGPPLSICLGRAIDPIVIKIYAWRQPWFFKGYFEYHIRDYHYLQLWCTFGNIYKY
jgi:hypothetical protein